MLLLLLAHILALSIHYDILYSQQPHQRQKIANTCRWALIVGTVKITTFPPNRKTARRSKAKATAYWVCMEVVVLFYLLQYNYIVVRADAMVDGVIVCGDRGNDVKSPPTRWRVRILTLQFLPFVLKGKKPYPWRVRILTLQILPFRVRILTPFSRLDIFRSK